MITLPTHGNQKRTSTMHRGKLRNIGRQDYRPEFRLLWHFDAHEPVLFTCIMPMTYHKSSTHQSSSSQRCCRQNSTVGDANLLAKSLAFPRGDDVAEQMTFKYRPFTV